MKNKIIIGSANFGKKSKVAMDMLNEADLEVIINEDKSPFSNEKLKRLRTIGVGIFYITSWIRRPIRPFRIIWNLAMGRQESRAEMALYNVFRRNTLKSQNPVSS